jgi:hypothetical protein
MSSSITYVSTGCDETIVLDLDCYAEVIFCLKIAIVSCIILATVINICCIRRVFRNVKDYFTATEYYSSRLGIAAHCRATPHNSLYRNQCFYRLAQIFSEMVVSTDKIKRLHIAVYSTSKASNAGRKGKV